MIYEPNGTTQPPSEPFGREDLFLRLLFSGVFPHHCDFPRPAFVSLETVFRGGHQADGISSAKGIPISSAKARKPENSPSSHRMHIAIVFFGLDFPHPFQPPAHPRRRARCFPNVFWISLMRRQLKIPLGRCAKPPTAAPNAMPPNSVPPPKHGKKPMRFSFNSFRTALWRPNRFVAEIRDLVRRRLKPWNGARGTPAITPFFWSGTGSSGARHAACE